MTYLNPFEGWETQDIDVPESYSFVDRSTAVKVTTMYVSLDDMRYEMEGLTCYMTIDPLTKLLQRRTSVAALVRRLLQSLSTICHFQHHTLLFPTLRLAEPTLLFD
jgi:hypothetical protein